MRSASEAPSDSSSSIGGGPHRLTALPSRRARPDQPARIVTARIPVRKRIANLVAARELLTFLIRKELKVKYKGSVLGILWSMLNPAVVLGVYYVVFTYFLNNHIPDFALYLFSGLIVWNLYSTAVINSSSSIVSAAGIVKKVAFPREVLALSQVGTASVFFGYQAIVLVIFLAAFRFVPAWHFLPLVLFALVDLVVFTAAISVFLAAINVYLRDIEHLIQVLMQAWFWGVPIIYSFLRLDHHPLLEKVYLADPMVPIILTFQRAIYGRLTYTWPKGTVNPLLPTWGAGTFAEMLAWVLGLGVVLFFVALVVFGRIEGNFAEEL